MKAFLFSTLIALISTACSHGNSSDCTSRADAIAAKIHDPNTEYVVVACHRGGDGNDDDAAYQASEPGKVYQQYLDNGVSMIQTDRPELLISWLKSLGRHSL